MSITNKFKSLLKKGEKTADIALKSAKKAADLNKDGKVNAKDAKVASTKAKASASKATKTVKKAVKK